MKKYTCLFCILLLLPALNFSSEYYLYYQNQKLEMQRQNNYLTVKFRSNVSSGEKNRALSKISPYIEKTMEFTSTYESGSKNTVSIVKLKNNVSGNLAEDLSLLLKQSSNVQFVGMSFTYNDKILHFSTDEVIVKFRKNVSSEDIDNLNRLFGSAIIEKVSGFENTYLVSLNPTGSDNVFDLSNKYSVTPLVEFAHPNFIRSGMLLDAGQTGSTMHKPNGAYIPNDTLVPYMWHVKNTGTNIPDGINGTPGCDMNLEPAWNITTGNPNVLIAIIDTGIDTNHTDLRPNLCDRRLWYDAYDNNQRPYDQYYHGTGVSGCAVATGNNFIGTAGVAFGCFVMPVRVFGPAPEGFTTDLILAKGLNWAWSHGACVMNCSWGGGIPGSLITLAIQNAVHFGRNGKGSVVFGGAGNADTNQVIYPASMPEVIGVGGLSPCNQRKSRTSCDNIGGVQDWGACYGEGMEIVAPCTYIGTTQLLGSWCICGNGTSCSSPLAAGVAGLILSKNINLSGDSVKLIIERTARKVGNYSYTTPKENGLWNEEMGYGMIDAYACLQMTPQGPDSIYDQVPPIIKIYPPESRIFMNSIIVEADIFDNQGVSTGPNAPRLYYRTLQNNNLQVITGLGLNSGRYRFTFPVIPMSEGFYYYIAAQDIVPIPNFITYPLGGRGVNPPGSTAPSKLMFVRNTGFYDTTFASQDVPITITSARETSFVSILNNPVAKTILDVNVLINAEHTFDADLQFSLISPEGTEIVLAGGVGWDGNNFTNTILDDDADIAIDSSLALPPFTGRFKPIDKLWLLDGENSLGQWKLRVVDNGFQDGGALLGWSLIIKYSNGPNEVTRDFRLVKNYPNPFNPLTRIIFNVASTANIKIILYDVTGREVKTILNETRQAATSDFVDFDATGLASGVYFYTMLANNKFIDSKRMVFVK